MWSGNLKEFCTSISILMHDMSDPSKLIQLFLAQLQLIWSIFISLYCGLGKIKYHTVTLECMFLFKM